MGKQIEIYSGDLIVDSKVNVICHQVNCQGVMGAGIAKQIHKTYPRVFTQYKKLCEYKKATRSSPLGYCQFVWVDENHSRCVANLFGQEYYGRTKQQTNYEMLRRALQKLATNKYLIDNNMTLGFPYLIGCALGGGDWNIVLPMLKEELAIYPHKVEIWKLN